MIEPKVTPEDNSCDVTLSRQDAGGGEILH